jgi:hypothetical protein
MLGVVSAVRDRNAVGPTIFNVWVSKQIDVRHKYSRLLPWRLIFVAPKFTALSPPLPCVYTGRHVRDAAVSQLPTARYPPESAAAAGLGVAVLHPSHYVLRLPGKGTGCVVGSMAAYYA